MVYIERSKEAPIRYELLYPEGGTKLRTVYLARNVTLESLKGMDNVPEAVYFESPQLLKDFEDVVKVATEKADADGHYRTTAAFFEAYLRYLFANPKLELVHLMTGYDSVTTFTVHRYGVITHE